MRTIELEVRSHHSLLAADLVGKSLISDEKYEFEGIINQWEEGKLAASANRWFSYGFAHGCLFRHDRRLVYVSLQPEIFPSWFTSMTTPPLRDSHFPLQYRAAKGQGCYPLASESLPSGAYPEPSHARL